MVKRGIEAAVGDVQTSIGHEEVVDFMDLAVSVRHRGFRVVAHAAGAGLVLAAAESQAGHVAPRLLVPASLSRISAFLERNRAVSMSLGWRWPESRATGMPQ